MKHVTLTIGLILIIAGSALLLLDMTTYGLNTSYRDFEDFQGSLNLRPQTYNNQTYTMAYHTEFIHANPDDKIVITTKITRSNNGVWATVFIEDDDVNNVDLIEGAGNGPAVILTYSTKSFPVYSAIVGTDTGTDQSGIYGIRLGAVSPPNSSESLAELGAYEVSINVYSKGSNSLYLVLGILLLSDGLIIPIIVKAVKSQQLKRI